MSWRLGDPLSRRQAEILRLACEGLTNRQIAKRLGLALRTVENHRWRGMKKLGATNRFEMKSALDQRGAA